MGCTGGSHARAAGRLRGRAAAVAALALVAGAAALAPPSVAAAEDGAGEVLTAAPDRVPARTAAVGGSACRGHMAWHSVAEPSPVQMRIQHELLVECGGTNVTIEGLSEMHYDLDLDTSNGFDVARCGPVTLSCLARERTDDPVLAGVPLRHRTWFRMRRTDGTVWTGDSSICVGEGTATITCEHNQPLLAGSSGSETFG